MANDLTINSTHSRPVSLISASNEQIAAVLHGQCDQARLVDSLRDLLSLYYQPNETTDMRARQIALFVKDLSDMSDATVFWAIDEWRRTMDRRPSPASLRQVCMMRRFEANKALALRKAPEAAPYETNEISPDEKAKRAAILERVSKAAGYVKTEHGQWTLPEDPKAKPARLPHWSETALPDDPRWGMLRKSRAEARAEDTA
jgi:hypothetical protein